MWSGRGRCLAAAARAWLSRAATSSHSSAPLPRGWTGKLWAVSQGVEAAGQAPRYLWLTDADIVHAPDTARSLVARAEQDGLIHYARKNDGHQSAVSDDHGHISHEDEAPLLDSQTLEKVISEICVLRQ